MKTIISFLALTSLVACGDDGGTKKTPDAPKPIDAKPIDAAIDAPSFPAAPTLGTQIDRMGRPAINTALNHAFNETNKGPAKDAYNGNADPATWATQAVPNETGNVMVKEFAKNLAIIDSLDTVCGNQPAYAGPASATSYQPLAGVLADDELHIDSTKMTCGFYLSLEAEVAIGVPHSQCGGRTPTLDVIDVSYSILAAGVSGFDNQFNPQVKDDAMVHGDVNNMTFPFLGPAH